MKGISKKILSLALACSMIVPTFHGLIDVHALDNQDQISENVMDEQEQSSENVLDEQEEISEDVLDDEQDQTSDQVLIDDEEQILENTSDNQEQVSDNLLENQEQISNDVLDSQSQVSNHTETGYDFFEDFGTSEYLGNILDGWTLSVGTNIRIQKDPVASDGQAGRGYSFYTNGTEKSFIEHSFGRLMRGKVSVDFYDDGTNLVGRMAQFNLTGAANAQNGGKPYIIGLGVNQNTGTQGFNHTNYCARIADDGRFINTGIKRTVGWHTFTIEVTAEGTNLWIDGTAIDTSLIPSKDIVTSFNNIQLGDKWAKQGETYFDNIRVEYLTPIEGEGVITGIKLNKENLSLNCGGQEQLIATIQPEGLTSEIEWSSDNEEIVRVDEKGNVTAGLTVGKAKVKAKSLRGGFVATCEITVTLSPEKDATLSGILVNDEEIKGFDATQYNYTLTIIDEKIPTISAKATQGGATIQVVQADQIPGKATIEVTSADGTTKLAYTIQLNGLDNVFFDDFNYTDADDLEKRGNWDVQEGTGRRPGNRAWWWKKENVVLMKDESDPTNMIVRLKAKTDGTEGENVSQSQIRYYEEKFTTGLYVARVQLYDHVMEADGPEGSGAWNATDLGLSTFFTINRIQGPSWEPYHESDFEYLFNGGWGGPKPAMHYTTWNSYAIDSNSESQTNQSQSTNNEGGSLDKKWIILTVKIDESGRTTYYIDGKQKFSHANKDAIVGPQSIAFNLWFINQKQGYVGQERTYWEDIDWVYYTADLDATTEDIVKNVEGLKQNNIERVDKVALPDISLNSITINGTPLRGFDNNQTEYFVTLPADVSRIPDVSAKANNQWAIVEVTPANELPGATTVYVCSSDLSVTKTYHINFTVEGNDDLAAPLSNFASGSMVKWRDVELFHHNKDAVIYYTTDGTTPTTSSNKYNGTPIRVEDQSMNVKAIAVANGKTSPVADFLYSVIPMTPQVTKHPTVEVSQNLTGTKYVTLEITNPVFFEVPGRTDNYRIYYTTDGTMPNPGPFNPNPSTKLYTGPIEVAETTTIRFTAQYPGICQSYDSKNSAAQQVTVTINDQSPKIVGVQDGGKYCGETVITVTDDKMLASVTVDGKVVTLTNNSYKLTPGTHEIIATDDTGNVTKVNVSVFADHDYFSWGNQYEPTCTEKGYESDKECKHCGNFIHGQEIAALGHHYVSMNNAVDATCTTAGHASDLQCKKCGDIVKGEVFAPLGEHHMTHVGRKEATATENGNVEYWYCERCGLYFTDENGVHEIAYEDTILPRLNEAQEAPNTSDDSMMGIYFGWMIISFIMITYLVVRKKEIFEK